MRRLAAFFVILLGVSACGSTAGTVALAVTANATSLFYTDKTLLDLGADAASGRDCSLLNIEKKEPYCQERAKQNGNVVTHYCYPTLGQPVCYKHPLPSGQGRVSFAVPNLDI